MATCTVEITFTTDRTLSQNEGQALWGRASHFVRTAARTHRFETRADFDDLTKAIDDVVAFISESVGDAAVTVGKVAAAFEEG